MSLRLLRCILFGHRIRSVGYRVFFGDYPDEVEVWEECTVCGQHISKVFDETTMIGRIRSWWYQE